MLTVGTRQLPTAFAQVPGMVEPDQLLDVKAASAVFFCGDNK
jgi:hypothetical protein